MSQADLSPLKRFWRLIKPDQKEIKNVYIYAIFYGLVTLSLPLGIQSIINLIQGGQMSTSWIVLVSVVILGVIATGFLQIQQLKISESLQQKIFTRAAFEFTYRLPRIKATALYKHYAPELMNRFFDVVAIQKGMSKILIDFSTASIQTLFGLLLLSLYHPFFIAFSLVLVALIYFIFRLTAQRGLDTSLVESKRKYAVAHWLEEVSRTVNSFKLAGETDLPMEKTNDAVKSYVDTRDSHFKVLVNQYSLMVIFKVLVTAGLLIVGSVLVMEQQMNIGQFVAAEIIILLIIGSVEKLILSLETIYDVLTSLEKVGQVTDLELESNEGIRFPDTHNGPISVCMENIAFEYPNQTEPLFEGLTLNVAPGERLLITGGNGSGKNTLLHLMTGLYDISAGNLSFNSIPYRNIHPQELRSQIGDSFSHAPLFEGTLLENITLGRPNISFIKVQELIERLELTPFIKSLPQGYNTRIEPGGRSFSKGVIDRLKLIRSIIDAPRLLLVDDNFGHLNAKDREIIFDYLTSPEHNWTLVIASKDISLSRKVDRTVSIENKGLFTA